MRAPIMTKKQIHRLKFAGARVVGGAGHASNDVLQGHRTQRVQGSAQVGRYARRRGRRDSDSRAQECYAGVNDQVQAWLAAVECLSYDTVPIFFRILPAKAVEIGRDLKLGDFRASRGFLSGFLSRTGI